MLFYAHSGLRYLVLLAGLVAILYAAWGAATRRPYGKPMRMLAAAYNGVLDLQILVGFFLVVSARYQLTGLIGHIFLAIFAAAVAHVTASGVRRKPPEERTHLPHLVGILVSLLLMAGGIVVLGRPVLGRLGPF